MTESVFRAQLLNCYLQGTEYEENSSGGWPNIIRLRLSRHRVEIKQLPWATSSPRPDFVGKQIHTTDVVIHGLSDEQFERGKQIAYDLSYLLSFATMNEVRASAFRFREYGESFTTIGVTRKDFRPTIQTSHGETVAAFIPMVWRGYRRLRVKRRLPAVIEYLLEADRSGPPLEVKILAGFVALENLKATYAKEAGFPFHAGYFRRPGGRPNPKRWPIYHFEELLRMMLDDVQMGVGVKRLVSLRNQIVHFGLSNRPVSSLSAAFGLCCDTIREYLLRILEYKGPFYPYLNCRRLKALK